MKTDEWVTLALMAVFLYGLLNVTAQADEGKWYAEIGVTHNQSLFQSNDDYKWDNAGTAGFYGSVRYEKMLDRDRLGYVLFYTHHSQWLAGPPFNNEGESSLDSIGFAVRWRLTRH
jgi:hypothetical protein